MDILTDCNEHLTMRLSKCPRTFHYPSIKMSMNISLSVYQNVNKYLTIRLSKCPRTSHYPFIIMSMNFSLCGYQNAHEHITITMTCSDQQMRFNKYFLAGYFN